MSEVRCLQCGWVWLTRFNRLPVICANKKCQSPYWNDPNYNPRRVARVKETRSGGNIDNHMNTEVTTKPEVVGDI
jgi:hypothetical protein